MTAKNDFLSLLLKAHSHLTQSDLETKWASAFQQRVMMSLWGGVLCTAWRQQSVQKQIVAIE